MERSTYVLKSDEDLSVFVMQNARLYCIFCNPVV